MLCLYRICFYTTNATLNVRFAYLILLTKWLVFSIISGAMDASNKRRLKVLLGCYACEPYRGSEPGMGWNFVFSIAKYHNVHVLVDECEFKESLTSFSQKNPDVFSNITLHFIPRKLHETLRKIYPPSFYWFYRNWQKQAYLYAKELDKVENFDIVHHITLSGFREPGYLWKLGKPFVWGPLGGFTDTPWCLLGGLGVYGAFFLATRNIINFFHKRWGRLSRLAAKNSFAILTSTHSAQQEIRKFWNREAILMNEVGLENSDVVQQSSVHEEGTPLKVCWAGVHEPRKALDLLLKALPYCKEKIEVHVLSKGPRTQVWKKLAQKMGVEDCVIFHGFVSREKSFRIMAESHVFCITSVREDTSTVVFEAFRYGLPIVALDHCGFAAVIDESSGIKIPIKSKKQVIRDYALNLDFLAANEDVRQRLAAGALRRCLDFTWEAKMKVINEIYSQAVKVNCFVP